MKEKTLKFLFSLLCEAIAYSYWICLIITIVATILYVAGLKKAGKYVPITMVTYFLLECFKNTVGESLK